MSDPIFIDAHQVADKLSIRVGHFRRQLDDLVQNHDFPQPMPYRGKNGATVWRAAHINAWLADQGLPKAFTPPRLPDDPKIRRLGRLAANA